MLWVLLLLTQLLHELWINDFLEPGICSIQTSYVFKNIFTIVVRHFHSSIVISKSWIWHFESLHRNGTNTSEISLITLALENGFLSKLDSVFFLQLSNHRLKKLQLILLLDYFRLNFNSHLFLYSSFILLVSGNLREELESLHSSSKVALVGEELAVFKLSLLSELGLSLIFEVGVENFLDSFGSPLINPCKNYCLIPIIL